MEGDFWVPLGRQVWRQSLVAPLCLLVVEPGGVRVVTGRDPAHFQAAYAALTVRLTRLRTLVLGSRATGQQVRLLPGSVTEGGRLRRLVRQLPPELRPRRYDDAAQRNAVVGGTVRLSSLPGQFRLTTALAGELVRRGAVVG